MSLRAKAVEEKENRFKALLFGGPGAGKSHFCCSFPETYYIDTEGLDEYEQFREMLTHNKSSFITLHELSDIVDEVRSLLTEKHHYKTLVIDSLTNVFEEMAFAEAHRLSKGGKVDGTEFQRHLTKPKRLLSHLCNMFRRLDMNIIVTTQEKAEYFQSEQIGMIQDIPKSVPYALGTIMNIKMIGNQPTAKFSKTRYKQFSTNELMNLSYREIENRLGQEMFVKEVKQIEIASLEQINILKDLIKLFNVPLETIQTAFTRSKSSCFEDMPADKVNIWIKSLQKKVPNISAEVELEEIISSSNKHRDDDCRSDDHD